MYYFYNICNVKISLQNNSRTDTRNGYRNQYLISYKLRTQMLIESSFVIWLRDSSLHQKRCKKFQLRIYEYMGEIRSKLQKHNALFYKIHFPQIKSPYMTKHFLFYKTAFASSFQRENKRREKLIHTCRVSSH